MACNRPLRAAGLSTLIVLAFVGCRGADRPDDDNTATPAENVVANTVDALPLPDPALDRAGFLQAMALAASAYSAGQDDRRAQKALDGRRFAVRIRFGCGPQSPTDASASVGWKANADSSSVEVRANPDLSLDTPALDGLDDQTIESVEGFWIPRPWLLADACPAQPGAEPAPAAIARQQVGIAEYFTADDSRVGRRSGRPYVASQQVDEENPLPDQGLVMVLEGRLTAWPDGKVIRCSGSGRDRAPSCVASAHLDRAAFVRPEDEEVIAEWRD